MIIELCGKITSIRENYLVLDVNGVGYKVENFAPFRLGLEEQIVRLNIYTHVRETEIRLFGFSNIAELAMFEKLLSVSGVGPKSAMLVVSNYSVKQIANAISTGDGSRIGVKGVGTKTLAKIVIELKGKLENVLKLLPEGSLASGDQEALIEQEALGTENNDLAAALESLGYRPQELKSIINKINPANSMSDQIKEALALLRDL